MRNFVLLALTSAALIAAGCTRSTELGSQTFPDAGDGDGERPVIINPTMDGGNTGVIPILPDDAGCEFRGVSGIDGANVSALAARADAVVAATWTGAFVSYDQGKSWITVKAFEGQKVLGVSAGVARFAAITDDGAQSHAFASDDGRIWTPAEDGLPSNLHAVELYQEGSEPLLVTSDAANPLFAFDSSAQKWSPVSAPEGTVSFTSLGDTSVALVMYGSTPQYRVGATGAWQDATVQSPSSNYDRVWTTSAGFVLSSQNALYLSTDGKTFAPISLPPGESFAPEAVLHGDAQIAGAFSNGVWRSSDGKSWQRLGDSPKSEYQQPRAIATDGSRLYVGTWQGVMRSQVGGVGLTESDTGLQGTAIRAVNRGGLTVIASTGGDFLYRSTDEGLTFTAGAPLQPGAQLVALARIGNTVFAGTSANAMFRSDDDGETFKAQSAGFPTLNGTAQFRDVTALAANGQAVVAGLSSGFARNTLMDDAWAAANAGLPIVGVDGAGQAMYPAVERLLEFNGAFFASTASGLFRSTDDGASWTAINNGIPLDANNQPPHIVALVQANGSVYAMGARYDGTQYQPMIARSEDGGDSWINLSKGTVPGTYILGATSDGGRLYAIFGHLPSQHDEKLVTSLDGTGWLDVSKAPSTAWPGNLTLTESAVVVGTMGNGLQRLSLSACTF